MSVAVFLLTWFLLFLAIGMVWPSWRVMQRHGKTVWVLPRSDTAEGVASFGFKVMIAALLIYHVLRAAGLPSDEFGPLHWMENVATQIVGLALLALSLPLVVLAQAHMGAAWRIGIDHKDSPKLMTSGVFRWSRNPIFLGMRLSLLGLLLIDPTAVTLTVFVAGEILMHMQVRLEEAFLASHFGLEYISYQNRTQRWFGLPGQKSGA
jgi:protein-S-isoprenylcysteine O-methyltransferase Ste14